MLILVPAAAREKRDIGQRIVLLENRLDGVMVQFNATLAQNTNVRKEIDHLVEYLTTIEAVLGSYATGTQAFLFYFSQLRDISYMRVNRVQKVGRVLDYN